MVLWECQTKKNEKARTNALEEKLLYVAGLHECGGEHELGEEQLRRTTLKTWTSGAKA